MPVKHPIGQQFTNEWQMGLCKTCFVHPSTCCYSCWCTPCKAYSQRNELLELTREKYVCAGGMLPCGCCSEPCAEDWLLCEVLCCPHFAVMVNRFLIQSRFAIRNTCCDDFIILCALCGACCSLSHPKEHEKGDHCSSILVCAVSGCMLTQHDAEIQHLRTVGYAGVPDYILQMLAPAMHQVVLRAPEQQAMQSPGYQAGKPVYIR